MGGKTKRKQTQAETQSNAPPAWAMPLFAQGAADAQRLYQSGQGGNVYQGQRVADMGAETQRGLQGLGDALAAFGQSGAQNGLGRPSAAQSNLADMAAGRYLSEGNPYYRERLNEAAGDMAARVNSQMAGAGRYGSGANSAVLAKNTSAMMRDGLERDYDRSMQNMLAANGMIDSANANALSGAGSYLRDWSNAAAALQQGGRQADAHAQDRLDAAQQKWREEDNRGWDRLALLQDAAKGFAGDYGTKTVNSAARQSERRSPWGDASGALSGLVRKSDCRAKEHISRAGFKNGFPLYEFYYKGGREKWRGVMAQDVLRLKPEAVSVDPADGLYCVDYGKLGFAPLKI